MILDYRSNDSPLVLIDKIGDTKISKDMIKNNRIELGNFTIECNTVPTDKLGTYEVKFVTSETDDRYHTKTVKVADISAPQIRLKEKALTMTLDEFKVYDFSKIIEVNDNWDKDEPIVNLTAEKITKKGTYTISVQAKDISGNQSTKVIKITIREKKKEEVKKETNKEEKEPAPNIKPSAPNTDMKESIPVQPKPTPSEAQPSIPSTPKPPNKDFLFSDGYTMDNVGNACQAALSSSGYSGACTPIKNADGIYMGLRLEFY